jgi:lysozyme
MRSYSYSQQGLALTEKFEGCRLSAYQDSVGVWTIGYGHTKGVKEGATCTLEEAQQWLQEDVEMAVKDVNQHLEVDVNQGEFDAMVDFTFNLGCGAFNGSTLLRLVNSGDLANAANEFEKWDHAGGKVVAGLLRRRLAEKEEFVNGNP